MNTQDCSQGFCSLYCPQWCYINFPPRAPVEISDDNSGRSSSPLVITVIGVLACAFLLASTAGLDEALINSITVCKYNKGDGMVEGTDCSVCLGEFQEDESLRLLPKCSHAFHVQCIDAWLSSHSNCPLCRANVITISTSPLPLPPPVTECPPSNELSHDENITAANDIGNTRGRNTVIEIRECYQQHMRRSVSMDHLCQTQDSVADILLMVQEEKCQFPSGITGSSSKQSTEASKSSNKMRVLHCVMNPVAMKRSFSSGRFFLARQARARYPSFPL